MLNIFGKKNPPLIGLDISSTAVKLIQLSRHGTRFKVDHFAIEPLAPKAVVEKNIENIEVVASAYLRWASVVRAIHRTRRVPSAQRRVRIEPDAALFYRVFQRLGWPGNLAGNSRSTDDARRGGVVRAHSEIHKTHSGRC